MRLGIYAVGRLKEKYLAAAEAEYKKRLGRLCKLEIREHADEAALVKALPANAKLVLLDERGELIDSVTFARDLLEAHAVRGGGAPLIFAIGGADGHSPELRARADRLIAFGRLTIAHRLVRVILIEQVYRGLSIIAGLPYHRG